MLSVIAALMLSLSSILPTSGVITSAYRSLNTQAVHSRTVTAERATITGPSYSAIPQADKELAPIQANKAAMLYDIDSARVLYKKNAAERLPIASITKVMTALVIMQNHKLDEIVTIPAIKPQLSGSQSMGIQPGEQFKLNEALTAMLTYSANDMAEALAIWDSGSEQAFVRKMNAQAAFWGLANTRYVDATGLGQSGSYSTAEDLTTLATISLQSGFFRQATSQPRYRVSNLAGKAYTVTNTNQLLGSNGVIGTKTGYTLEAGQCLLSLTRRDGHEIIGVILGSNDRFGQTKALLNTAYATYRWE